MRVRGLSRCSILRQTAYTVKSSPLQEQLQGLILAVCRHRAFALTLRNSSLTGPRKTGSRPGSLSLSSKRLKFKLQ